MSILNNGCMLSQSVKKSINDANKAERIDITIHHYPVLRIINSKGKEKDGFEDPIADNEVIVVIKNNHEEALANSDVVLYRVGRNKSLFPVEYTRTSCEGICRFINSPDNFKKK